MVVQHQSQIGEGKDKDHSANEIASLKRRVKKLEKKSRSRTHKLKRLYKVGLTARVESSGDEEDLGEDASKQGQRINAIDADEDITLYCCNNNVVEEVVDAAQDNGKGIMIKELMKPMKKKDLIRLDEEVVLKLQAEFDKEEKYLQERKLKRTKEWKERKLKDLKKKIFDSFKKMFDRTFKRERITIVLNFKQLGEEDQREQEKL
ncbi:hypothetical protein Tco_1102391 [Tanacetum coccineum]